MIRFDVNWVKVFVVKWHENKEICCDVFPKLEDAENYANYLKGDNVHGNPMDISISCKTIYLRDFKEAKHIKNN